VPDPTVRAICAGASAGLVEAFANCPFEVVKVRMQAKSSVRAKPTTIRLVFTQSIVAGIQKYIRCHGADCQGGRRSGLVQRDCASAL